MRAIREQTDDAEHLDEFMLRVFRGEVERAKLGAVSGEGKRPAADAGGVGA